MHLHRGAHAAHRHDRVRAGERVDDAQQDVMGGIAIQLAVTLRERNQLRDRVEGIERQHGVLFRQMEVRRDLRR